MEFITHNYFKLIWLVHYVILEQNPALLLQITVRYNAMYFLNGLLSFSKRIHNHKQIECSNYKNQKHLVHN